VTNRPIQGGMLELHEGMWEGNPIHLGRYVLQQMRERNWTLTDLAEAMGGDWPVNLCAMEFACVNDRRPGLQLGRDMAEGLGRAFGTSAELWLGLDLSSRHFMATGECGRSADCRCEACANQPPAEHYVNGTFKGGER
jgi:plasmid maintenance system antidote protein VapI